MQVFQDLPSTEYFSNSAISASLIRRFATAPTPYHFKNTPEKQGTAALQLGTLVHDFLENGGKPDIAVAPDSLRRGTKAYKIFEEENEGKKIVKQKDYDDAKGMYTSIVSNPFISQVIADGVFEESYFGEYKGQKVKFRTDLRSAKHKVILDFKTTKDAGPGKWEFTKSIRDYRYDIQSVFYADQVSNFYGDEYDFIFVAVEKVEPYAVGLYTLSQEDKASARAEIDELIAEYAERSESENWGDGYGDFVQEIDLDLKRKERAWV